MLYLVFEYTKHIILVHNSGEVFSKHFAVDSWVLYSNPNPNLMSGEHNNHWECIVNMFTKWKLLSYPELYLNPQGTPESFLSHFHMIPK